MEGEREIERYMYSSIVSTINGTCVCGRLIQELKYVNRKSDQVTLAMSDAETKAGSPRENGIKMWLLGALWVYISHWKLGESEISLLH